MKLVPGAAFRPFLPVAGVAVAWVALFRLNAWLFQGLEVSIRANWIFLPAALRPLSILLFGRRGVLGLVLGACVTAYGTAGGDHLHEFVLAVLSGVLPWMAVEVWEVMLSLPESLSGLRFTHIVALCVMCAAANAAGLQAYLWLSGRLHADLVQVVTVFVGDIAGAAIVLFLASRILSLLYARGAAEP